MGLQIHNIFPTHRQGNTLDLIMSESISELEVMTCHPGPFMSDLCLVQWESYEKNQDSEDDALIFLDIITAMGLQIHNIFPTNRQGNTLDLIMSESISELEVMTCHLGPFMSDHCLVQWESYEKT